jgi:hypothetical protein
MVSTSFSAKFNDAIISGRPILVYGPEYASLPAYFRAEGLPLCVTEKGGLNNVFSEIEAHDGPDLISQYHDLVLRNHSPEALAGMLSDRSSVDEVRF